MAQPRLRIYYGPQEETIPAAGQHEAAGKETVTLPLSEVFPLLADAVESRRTWLQDFADDEITVSSDLYEVILAYQHYRRTRA